MTLTRDSEIMLRSMLAKDAARMSAGRPLPIDLSLLLEELGIALVRDAPTSRSAAHGNLRRQGTEWVISVNAATSERRQRFTVAHEVGHYLIEARVGVRPGTSSEYWALESICQGFAAALLSPPEVVERALTPMPTVAHELVDAAERVAAATDISLEAAVKCVVDAMDRPVAVGAIGLQSSPRLRSSGQSDSTLLWLHGNQTWIRSGRGKVIRKGHVLESAVALALSIAPRRRAAIELPGAMQASLDRREGGFVVLTAFLDVETEVGAAGSSVPSP